VILLASDAGPTVTLAGWYAWITVAVFLMGGAVGSVAFLNKVLLPLATAVADIRKDYPVWADIAEKFGDEGGRETISTELSALASNQALSAANQQTMLAQLQTVIAQSTALDAKVSETRHQIIGEFTALRLVDGGTETLVQAIVRVSNDLKAVQQELAQFNAAD
jgi:hypothetical protein